MFYSFQELYSVVHPSAYVHPQSRCYRQCLIIGKDVYIGPELPALRGDWGGIVIEDSCNVQENCTTHMFPGVTVLLKESACHEATLGRLQHIRQL